MVMVTVVEEGEEEEWQTTHTTSIKRVCILNWLNSNNSILLLYNKLDKEGRLSRSTVVLLDLMVRLMVRTTSPRMVHTVHSTMDTVDFPLLNQLVFPPIHHLHLPILKMMMNRCHILISNFTAMALNIRL